MKEYISPVLEVVENLELEPVYASSGSFYEEKPEGSGSFEKEWTVQCKWAGHNGGSHSNLHISANHHGAKAGESVRFHFACHGFRLAQVSDTSGYIACNVTENGFDFIRNNHFNATDNIGFTVQLIAKDSVYHGAVADSNNIATEAGKNVVCTSCFGS